MISVAEKQSADDQLATALKASLNEFNCCSPSPQFTAEKEEAEALEQVNQLLAHWYI